MITTVYISFGITILFWIVFSGTLLYDKRLHHHERLLLQTEREIISPDDALYVYILSLIPIINVVCLLVVIKICLQGDNVRFKYSLNDSFQCSNCEVVHRRYQFPLYKDLSIEPRCPHCSTKDITHLVQEVTFPPSWSLPFARKLTPKEEREKLREHVDYFIKSIASEKLLLADVEKTAAQFEERSFQQEQMAKYTHVLKMQLHDLAAKEKKDK